MISFFEEQLAAYYLVAETYKNKDDKWIAHMIHKESGAQFLMRSFVGNAAPYQALLPVCHPNLPQVYEAIQEGERAFVIEEFIEGDSVGEMLAETTFTTKEVKQIALDLCEALGVLHSLGIVHRDVKPENILLRGAHAVLIDMDASRLQEGEKNRDTTILGTVGYAAPEQFGISQTNDKADIYALGVTMNQMLTGEHPSTKLAKGRFGRIISKCTMVHPGKRYQSVLELKEAMQGL
ncbi:MAG: serine/threonine protein kinase [Lachnospiraceae bacterium]|nr:serine/threonine protein kinase [Lachnospiraceae bacterium]